MALFGDRADQRVRIAEAIGTILEACPERRIFDRAVARGQAQQEAVARQVIQARRLLGNRNRIAQRQAIPAVPIAMRLVTPARKPA